MVTRHALIFVDALYILDLYFVVMNVTIIISLEQYSVIICTL